MATTSFDKDFVVRDQKAITEFKSSLAAVPVQNTIVNYRDIKAESQRGIELLRRSLSR
jgi:hypothetical protein